ncbi:unnamed protein product [Rotaria sp. Silwood2]|nr:unnamed protein product [Rotaria sp. Silwood2]
MKGDLTARAKTKKTLAIQHRIDTLYARYNNGDINATELLDGQSDATTLIPIIKQYILPGFSLLRNI